MAEPATTYLDSRQFEQALAILERERPSRREERRFRLLNQCVWGAVFLTVGWFVLLFSAPAIAQRLLIIAVLCYVLSAVMFVANLGLGRKLLRAAMLRRSLHLSQRLRPTFRARRRRHRIYNWVTLALTLLGYAAVLFGIVGLLVELFGARDSTGLSLAVVQLVFGLGCISIHFIARGKERLDVISELRADLVGRRGAPGAPIEVPAERYDQIASIERAQIQRDRKHSIARPGVRADTYVLRMSRSLREVESRLEPDVLMRVTERAYELLFDPRPSDATRDPASEVSFVPVRETGYELGFVADHDRREVHVMELRSAAGTAPRAGY